jgi:hypothetical protein
MKTTATAQPITPAKLRVAAKWLEGLAQSVEESNMLDGRWPAKMDRYARDAKREVEYLRRTAAGMRALANILGRSRGGGPSSPSKAIINAGARATRCSSRPKKEVRRAA